MLARIPRLNHGTEITSLDRLTWAEGIAILAYGVRIGVRATRAGTIERFLPSLPPSWRPAASPIVGRMYSIVTGSEKTGGGRRTPHLVYADAERIVSSKVLAQAIDAFESDLQLYVAEVAPRRVFVHAGVVGRDGQAIVFPGRSFSGKTTLTAALVKAGCTYYSDEYAVLDEAGRVHPYARKLGIREGDMLERATRYDVETLGGRAGRRPLPVKLIIVSQYKPDAIWRPRRLSAGQGVLAMFENTVSARRGPREALTALRRAAEQSLILRGVRGEAEQVAAFVCELLSREFR